MKRTLLSLQKGVIALILLGSAQTASAQKTEWVTAFGGKTGRNAGSSIAVDGNGNTYTAGYMVDTITLNTTAGSVTLNGASTTTGFLTKTNPSGAIEWVRHIGPGRSVGNALALDADGNVYVTGYFQDSIHFDPAAPASYLKTGRSNTTSNRDVFIAKLAPNGNHIWVKRLGGAGTNEGNTINVSASGSIYLAGTFTSSGAGVSYDGQPGIISTGGKDMFISKLNATDGSVQWVKSVGGLGDETVKSLAVDNQENILITGAYKNEADFNPDPGVTNNLPAPPFGQNDVFVLKLDKDGIYKWAKSWGSTGGSADIGNAIAVDKYRNVYITGQYIGTNVDFDPDPTATFPLTSKSYDIFVSKLDENGVFQWAKGYGSTEVLDEGTGIATDTAGNVFVTGVFLLTTDFNPGGSNGQVSSSGNRDVFVLKLAGNGDFNWVKSVKGSDWDGAGGITVGEDGIVYTTGWVSKNSDFFLGLAGYSSIPHVATAEWDVFIHKINQVCTSESEITLSNCGPYQFNGSTYSTSDIYQIRLMNIHGCDSNITLNLTIKENTAETVTINGCDSVSINGITYYTSDSYTQTHTNVAGCDSILTCIVTVGTTPVADVVQNGTTLTAGLADTWAWIDCDNNTPVPDATDQVFTPDQSGRYALVATSIGGCSDTSDCYTVEVDTETGIYDLNGKSTISVYPNPAQNVLFIKGSVNGHIRLTGADGKTLLLQKMAPGISSIDLSGCSTGMYLLHMTDAMGHTFRVEKITKAGQ